MRAKFLERSAKFALDLHAMQIHGNFDISDRIIAEKHAMRLANVEKFDGEHIGGMNQFFASENARRRFIQLARPPAP